MMPSGKKVIGLPALTDRVRSIEPFAKKIELSRVSIESPDLDRCSRQEWRSQYLKLVPEADKTEKKRKDAAGSNVKKEDKDKKTGPEPLRCVIDLLELKDGRINFSDASLKDPAKITLEKLEIKGEKISLAKDSLGLI